MVAEPVTTSLPSVADLERLAGSADLRERAFAAGTLAMGAEDPETTRALYERLRATASEVHADVRTQIREKTLDAASFVRELRRTPLEVRDHLVEEILDIAYLPPEPERIALREGFGHAPTGLEEILFVVEHAELGPEKTFVDLGSGLGKVVLLVTLLTGARAVGVEIDLRLLSRARAAASSLALDNAEFVESDLRDGTIPSADVYFMYIPLARSVDVAARLHPVASEHPILLFSQALDLGGLPWLKPRHASSYWLEMYEGRAVAV